MTEALSLHDVKDVDAWCSTFIERAGLELSYHDREDLLAYVVVATWELSEQYRPGAASFSTWAGGLIGRKIADWKRSRYRTKWQFKGRVYERPRPVVFSIDADDSERHRLDETLSSRAGDPTSDSNTDLRGLVADRDRERARDLDTLGLEAHG